MSAEDAGAALVRLLGIMARLRGPGGCPWDAEQTPESLKPYLLEETYEVLEALDSGVADAIRDELGDLLLQVVFHARIFEERQQFDMCAVANAISDKLERRHPHVFADQHCPTDQLSAQWERIKATEGGSAMAQGSVGKSWRLPALLGARKDLGKLARQGPDPLGEIDPQALLTRLATAAESGEKSAVFAETLGDLLLATVEIGRRLDLDAEDALRQSVKRHAKADSR
jgi:tetrapyrrole methylase family protein / MazG family protein